ncbi:YbaB/EbfC family nucleoid-associated protein [Glycomyces sp. L485]|uniref:YbaB/EbfC family nucleoid-associated protein n=1 Tax=Glycomyces sp. L485 TaxID=2909235 RepID=UPI001F4B8308|nr:YbaB/EbfC family nucleoid-associated protein [Glycomyces sp. L485]MCH7231098.1 YbaB/EbfC family nucleoid-associated protein [Glycomyces sp. L485]
MTVDAQLEVRVFGEDQIAQQLADARATLQNAIASPEDSQVEPVTAEAADGRLRVTVGTEGRIERFELDPRVLKEGSEYVAEQLKLAVNEALDQRAEALGTDEPVPDLEAVNDSVAEIQDRSLRQFQAMSASISEVMGKLHGGR